MRKNRRLPVAAMGCAFYFSMVTRALAQGCPAPTPAPAPYTPPAASSTPTPSPMPAGDGGFFSGASAAAAAAAAAASNAANVVGSMSPNALPTDVNPINIGNPVIDFSGGTIDADIMTGTTTPSMNAVEFFGGSPEAVTGGSKGAAPGGSAAAVDTKAASQALFAKYQDYDKQVFEMRKQKEALEKEIQDLKNSKYKAFEEAQARLEAEGKAKVDDINKLIEKANEKWQAAWERREDELYAEYKSEFYGATSSAGKDAATARYHAKFDREYAKYQANLDKEGAGLNAQASAVKNQTNDAINKAMDTIWKETEAKVAAKELSLAQLKENYDALVSKRDAAEKEFKKAAEVHNATCSTTGTTSGGTSATSGGGSSGGGSGGLTTRELVEGYENQVSAGVSDTGSAGMTQAEYNDKKNNYHNEHASLTEERTRLALEIKNSDHTDPNKVARLNYLDDRIHTVETRWTNTQTEWNKQQAYLAQVAREAKARADADAAAAAKRAQEQAQQTTQTTTTATTTTPIEPYVENRNDQEYSNLKSYEKENELKALEEFYHFRQRTQKYLEDALANGTLEQNAINDVLATAGGFRNSSTYDKLPPDVKKEIEKFESFWNNAGKALPQGLQAVSGLEGQVKTEAQRNKEFMDNIAAKIKENGENINVAIPDVAGKYTSSELGQIWIITRPVPDESVKTRNMDITGTFTPPGEEHQVKIVGKFDGNSNNLEFTYKAADGQTKIVKLAVNPDGSLTGGQKGADGNDSKVTAKRPDKYEIPIGSRGGGYDRDSDSKHINDLSTK